MIRPLVVPAFAVLVVSAALAAQDAGSAAQEKAPAARAQSPAAAPQAPAASADAQAPPPSFPAQVEQVIVDMVVTDKKGEPVRGLKRGDMSVYEDGVQQTIVSFDAVELPDEPLPVAPPPPRVSVNTEAADARGRTFVIVFDDVHMTPWKASRSKAAVASFLEKGVREGDRVTLISTAGGLWWSERMESGRQKLIDLVKRLDGRYVPDTSPERMSDAEAMRIHLYRDPDTTARVMRRYQTYGVTQAQQNSDTIDSMRQGTLEDPFVTARAAEVYYQAMTRLRITLDVLERALNGLAEAKGRKSVILVSEGFIHDINLDEFKRVSEAARRANAAIYFVNSRGLEGMPASMTAQFATAIPDQDVGVAFTDSLDAVAGAEDIADDSGGFTVRNTNDLSSGIQRIARETQAYYLLGYIPTNTARDGKFRKIEVKLADGKGLKVRARKGYYAPSDTGKTAFEDKKKGVDPVIQAALDSPWSEDAIPLRMTDYVGEEKTLGKAQVMVATEVDVRSLDFEEQDGRYLDTLEFLLVVAHRESGEFFRYDQSVNMKLLPATRDRLRRLWFPVVRDFELRAGDYQAKIVVRDKRSGRVGTVMHEFEVPPLDKFRVSTPILSDTRLTGAAAEGSPAGRLAVIVRREFQEGSDVFCQIEVFGAKKDERSGMPRVVHGYTVRRPDGSIFTSIAPSVIRPTSLGNVSRLFGFSLGDAPPGDYEIVMNLRDELAGTSVVLHEPFKVVPPVPGAAGSPAGGK